MKVYDTSESKWLREQADAEMVHHLALEFAYRAILHLLQASLLAEWGIPVLAARVLFEVPLFERRLYLAMLPDFLVPLSGTPAEAPLVAAQVALDECAARQHEGTETRQLKAARLRDVGAACVAVASTMHIAATRAVIWRHNEAARLYDVVRSGKTFVVVRSRSAAPDTTPLRVEQKKGRWPEGTSVCRLDEAPKVRVK